MHLDSLKPILEKVANWKTLDLDKIYTDCGLKDLRQSAID